MPEERSASEVEVNRRWLGTGIIVVFGIIAPLVSLGVELATHMCADAFFDPIPTVGHAVLAGVVPIVNALLLARWLRGRTSSPRVWRVLSGASLAISGFYALVFVPLVPLSVIALLVVGMGLLSLAPITAFLCAVSLHRRNAALLREAGSSVPSGAWAGALAGLAALTLVDLPGILTHAGAVAATSEVPSTRAGGIAFLRSFGNDEMLARAVGDRMPVMSPVGSAMRLATPLDTAGAADTYFRVTGASPAVGRRARLRFLLGDENLRVPDDEQGGTAVGTRLEGLCLDRSVLSGVASAATGVADLAWDLEFRNTRADGAEARMLVALPPGGVVHGATLWVNGLPRPAVFGGKQQTRAAYEKVVRVRRDPLLVTEQAPGRVLVQCFPVPAGGTMRIAIDLALPVDPAGDSVSTVVLPRLEERNFCLCDGTQHVVRVTADRAPAESQGPFTATPAPDGVLLEAAFGEREVDVESPALRLVRAAGSPRSAAELSASAGSFVVQRVELVPASAPASLVIVVDASGAMASQRAAVESFLDELPDGVPLAFVIASDEVVAPVPQVVGLDGAVRARVREAFADLPWAGGVDSTPALLKAWELAGDDRGSVVLWLHGPQPFRMRDAPEPQSVAETWRGQRSRPRLVDVPLVRGPNVLSEALAERALTERLASEGDMARALAALRARWFGETGTPTLVRAVEATRPADASLAGRALVSLWARDEVERLVSAGSEVEAVRAAVTHRIVTPVSGAVVLETDAEYEEAGLEPPQAGTVPTVPEPGTWGLLAVLALVLAGSAWRARRRRTRPA